MKTKLLIWLLIVAIVLLSGCAEKECKTAADCSEKTCSAADCKDNSCVYSPVSDCCGNDKCEQGEAYETCVDDCPNCDDSNDCTTDSFDFYEQKCVNTIIEQCCGNGMCEIDIETYETCPTDCPNCDDDTECTVDEYDYHLQECANTPILDRVCCGNGVCETGEDYTSCSRDCPDCGVDTACKTNTRYDYHKQECVSDVLIPCCGNEICDEGAETSSDCLEDCPDCDDNNKLTTDSFNYATQKCENPITHYFIDDFEEGTDNWVFTGGEGTWSTIVEDSNTVLKGVGRKRADLQGKGWTNYIFKFRFKIIRGLMGVHFKFISQEERYTAWLSETSVSLDKRPMPFSPTPETVQLDLDEEWHDFEVRVYENTFNIYMDDNLLMKYSDNDTYALLSGTVSLVVDNEPSSEFLIDDVEIKLITEGDISYP